MKGLLCRMPSLKTLSLILGVLAFTPFILSASEERRIDLNSYCKGKCSQRYQDGMYLNGKCACMDYFDAKPKNRLESPKRPIEFDPPQVYDGSDVIHYAEGE